MRHAGARPRHPQRWQHPGRRRQPRQHRHHRSYRLTASGFGTAFADLIIRDANRHDLTVKTKEPSVLENSYLALVGTVTRPVVTDRSQVIALRSNHPDRLTVPATVTIAANQAS